MQTYIVTSKPKRISVTSGFVHMSVSSKLSGWAIRYDSSHGVYYTLSFFMTPRAVHESCLMIFMNRLMSRRAPASLPDVLKFAAHDFILHAFSFPHRRTVRSATPALHAGRPVSAATQVARRPRRAQGRQARRTAFGRTGNAGGDKAP